MENQLKELLENEVLGPEVKKAYKKLSIVKLGKLKQRYRKHMHLVMHMINQYLSKPWTTC